MTWKKILIVISGNAAVMYPTSQTLAQDNPCGIDGVVVQASNFSYSPEIVQIEQGQTVVWVNVGGFHDVNGQESTLGDEWNNPETFYINPVSGDGDGTCIGTYTFTEPGTYQYDCSIGSHAQNGMVGQIIVNESNPSHLQEYASEMNFSIYPNPASGGYIRIEGKVGLDAPVVFVDTNGRIIYRHQMKDGDNFIDVSNWRPGIYSALWISKNSQGVYKILIDR